MANRRDSNPPSTTTPTDPDAEPKRMSALIPLAWFAVVIVGAICCEVATRH